MGHTLYPLLMGGAKRLVLVKSASHFALHTLIDGRAISEASGRVNASTVVAIAEAGVDYISVGRITHSAPCLDLGLDIDFA